MKNTTNMWSDSAIMRLTKSPQKEAAAFDVNYFGNHPKNVIGTGNCHLNMNQSRYYLLNLWNHLDQLWNIFCSTRGQWLKEIMSPLLGKYFEKLKIFVENGSFWPIIALIYRKNLKRIPENRKIFIFLKIFRIKKSCQTILPSRLPLAFSTTRTSSISHDSRAEYLVDSVTISSWIKSNSLCQCLKFRKYLVNDSLHCLNINFVHEFFF